MESGAGELDEHDFLEGGLFIGGERGVHLLDGAVDFIEHRDAQEDVVEGLEEFAADVIAGEASDQADHEEADEQCEKFPIPEQRSGSGTVWSRGMGDTFGDKEEEGVSEAGDCAEDPDRDDECDHDGHDHGKAGEKIGLPASDGPFEHGSKCKPRTELLPSGSAFAIFR